MDGLTGVIGVDPLEYDGLYSNHNHEMEFPSSPNVHRKKRHSCLDIVPLSLKTKRTSKWKACTFTIFVLNNVQKVHGLISETANNTNLLLFHSWWTCTVV